MVWEGLHTNQGGTGTKIEEFREGLYKKGKAFAEEGQLRRTSAGMS